METKPHRFQQNPDNPPPSPLPPRPSPEANNNVAPTQPAQQQNLKRPSESNRVSVTTGIPPLPNSSNNSGRKRRTKKSKSTQQDILLQPQYAPQIPQNRLLLQQQQDQLRQMQQNQLLLLQQQEQLRQMQQNQLLLQRQEQLRQMQQNQLLLQQRRLSPQPMQQRQWLQPQPQQQRSPQVMQQCMRQSNMQRNQGHSYSNFLMEVMHYQWAKPHNNSIGFWRQYVAKYYDSKAKERLCLSKCNDNGICFWDDTKRCGLCGWKPERVFEVSFEELPERLRVKFEIMEGERLDMGVAEEHKTVPGLTILLCPKATQRSIYGRESVVHEGLLRIGITDQWKILSWEFCVSQREAFVSFPPLSFRGNNWLGIGEMLRRPEAKNVPAESPEEGLQRNNRMVQDTNIGFLTFQTGNNLDFSRNCPCPKVEKACDSMEGFMDFSMQRKLDPIGLQNSSRPCPGAGLRRQEMLMAKHQANAQGQQINHVTMNSTRAIHPSPSSYGSSNHYRVIGGQKANRIPGKAVSVDVDNIQTAALPFDSRETRLTRNPAANLRTPSPEEQLISHSTMNNPQATHIGQSSHMIIGGQNANGIPGNGVARGMGITQTAAALSVESGETGLIPKPTMELQVQEMPVMEHPTSAQRQLTDKDTMNSPMVINDHTFIDQQNGNEIEMLEGCVFDGVDITEATALADEDIETYLIDYPAAEFPTQEMQVMNHQGSVQGQVTNHGPRHHEPYMKQCTLIKQQYE